MWEVLKDLPKGALCMVLGGALAIYIAGYFTAQSARERGFEAEFSDYGLLKKISAPESPEVKNCRELRLSYDAGRQALAGQMHALGDRVASANQAIASVLKEYPAARKYD